MMFDAPPWPAISGDFWVFGYGSLMWHPGFPYEARHTARVYGYHRRFCVWSVHYRGSPESPGLVLGLDRGGSCRGIAYQVPARDAAETQAYLREREMISQVYRPLLVPLRLPDQQTVQALTFVSRAGHPQFAPPQPLERVTDIIAGASGKGGCNRSYVLNTAAELAKMGIRGGEIQQVARRLAAEPPN